MAVSSDIHKSIFDWLVAEFCTKHFPVKLWSYGLQSKVLQHLVGANSAIENGKKPTKLQLVYSKLYDVLTVDGITRVIVKKVRQDGSVRVMLPKEEFFDVINSYHEKMGHVGPAKLSFAVRQRYVVPKLIISLFAKTCTVCCDVQHVTDKSDSEINCSTGYAGKNSELLPSKDREQVLHLSQSGENRDGASYNSSKIKTPRVPQPPPAQKPLQPPQAQTQKVLPPQQVTAPKPIAPKPSPVAQPVSPIQPLPPPPEVCLRWNSYHSNMQATFPSLLNNEQFVDVTLACEGRSIKCHKMMLSACSAYFEELLSQNPCQHPIVLMKDLRYWEVQALVDFMYRGEVNVGQDKLPSLLAAAEALQIKGLAGPAFSSNDDDNNSQPTPVSATEDYIDEPAQSPSSSRRAKRRRVMSSTLTPRVQSTPSQPVPSSPKTTSISGKRSVKPVSVPSTSSNFALESPSVPTEPPSRRARKSETDLVGQIKIEPIDIEINNDSMDDMEDSFLDKPYDDTDLGEESNCLSNDPGGTDNSKNLDLGDTMKTLHGHEADNLDYGTNNSTSGSDQNFKYDDSGSQDDGLISDIPGTSYQDSLIQPSSSGMSNSNSNVNDSLLGHM